MPRMETRRIERKMAEVANTIPKQIQKSLAERLGKLSTDECITVTVTAEVRVSCIWDEGNEPTMDFCELNESPEDMLDGASDQKLKKLGLLSVIELKERIQKEITEWNDDIKQLEKEYSLEKDLLADFFIDGYYEDN